MQSKEFVIEEGVMYYRKKTFYKQALFWTTLIGFFLSFIFGTSLLFVSLQGQYVTPIEPYYDDYSAYSDYYDVSQIYREYQVGEEAQFLEGMSVRVIDMGKDSSVKTVRTFYDAAFVVNVEVKNTGTEDIYFDEYSFYLVDSLTERTINLDLRTYDVNIPEKLVAGEKVELKLVYGVYDEDLKSGSPFLVYNDTAWYQLVTEGI